MPEKTQSIMDYPIPPLIDDCSTVVVDAMCLMELNQIADTPFDFQDIATNNGFDLEFAEITSDSSLRFQYPAPITSIVNL
ncbi:hypothetical protein ACTXT7_001919 [Hymenolepis weldensis]